MNQLITEGIILSRTNYGEADRIITLLTPDHGKLRLMAKGVRKINSKLAGGIELFCTSNISFIKGRGEIGTLTSTRLIKYYSNIVSDIGRVEQGYSFIKLLNKTTEDMPEPEYYNLMQQAFAALDDFKINAQLINAWFWAQLLKIAGHTPNLTTDGSSNKLEAELNYNFDLDTMNFFVSDKGSYGDKHIKLLRLCFSSHSPDVLERIKGLDAYLPETATLTQAMLKKHIRI
jgi:DNA repair protein RecO